MNKILKNHGEEYKVDKINGYAEGYAKLNSSAENKNGFSIPYILPNEVFEYDKTNKYVKIIKKKSQDRVDHHCKHFFDCGGCLLQHWRLSKYIEWKRNLLALPLTKISPITNVKDLKIVKLFSRRRAKFFINKTDFDINIGFKSYKTHNIINLSECSILDQNIINILEPGRKIFSQILKKNDQVTMSINALDEGLDILIRFNTRYNLLKLNFSSFFLDAKNISRITLQYKDKEPDLIGQLNSSKLFLQDKKTYMLPPPGGFFQATRLAEKIIIDEILLYFNETKQLKVLDLFSGCGTLSLPLLNRQHYVFAIDINEISIKNLVTAAKEQNLFNKLKIKSLNLMKKKLEKEFLKSFDVVIIDPPRAGAKMQISSIAEAKVPRVISISCNVKSFLSDCKILINKGYKLKSITPIDQFLFTGHLETLGIFEI